MRRDTPLRRSLTVRLLALSALVSLCSIAATAWLAARTTTGAIKQEQTQVLADQTRIYHELLGYAATHPDWNGAQETVRRLAAATGQRIVLATPRFEPVIDSAAGPAPTASAGSGTAVTQGPAVERAALPRTPTTIVDPLSVDLAMLPGAPSDRIDARAVGPFRLTPAEHAALEDGLVKQADCLRTALGIEATVTDDPAGRPHLRTADDRALGVRCAAPMVVSAPTRTETAALADLTGLVNACLARQQIRPVTLTLGPDGTPSGDPRQDQVTSACLTNARRQQLVQYVAPPVLLFVGAPVGAGGAAPVLTSAHPGRVTEVAALVLVATVAITVTVGLRLSRPLHALTHAARRMADGDLSARVTVTGRNEIAGLAAAFNAMAERRGQLEDLRKAMVGDIAHELRTPLSNIRGWLEAVEDGVATADRALTGSLLEEALLLQHLIDDLRDLAAADAGELALYREPVDVDDLLVQVATAHGAQAQASGVALAVDPAGAAVGVDVFADPVRLRQAVGNLVANAVRHTPAGGTVTLRARARAGALLIEVADTGTGIAAADLPLVFERFWRAEKSRNRQTGGSGLGLAIVRKLAELHGGGVHVASTPGAGSVFTVRLPSGSRSPEDRTCPDIVRDSGSP
ncbi:two-component system sensor histidine kinase BaeS [Kitasatospora sp. MAA19]|uniref:sensor histidine kinase n=1 Tax=Kitasatospora sp. MAA19 TaxID=3035090 RepID=UPI002476EB6B|nr:HAMP domain-containing sensor histidine kinase [Kitasatospora sp. MAA19]MDH6711143.1 two-component system sensor histidine kinase BaeS [Kitasatospora sp. MAA19]